MSKKSPGHDHVVLPEQLTLRDDFPASDFEDWRNLAKGGLGGKSWGEVLETQLDEGLRLNPIYTGEDAGDGSGTSGFPGFFPFARGAEAGRMVGGGWQITQEIDADSPDQCNQIMKDELSDGHAVIHLRVNTASPGRGLSITSLEDMRRIFSGIDPAAQPVYLSTDTAPFPLAKMLEDLFGEQGRDVGGLQGGILFDPLSKAVTAGEFKDGFEEEFDQIALLCAWARDRGLKGAFRTVEISGLPFHQGGAHAVQELAFVMSSAVEYLGRLLEERSSLDDVAPFFRFSFGVGPQFFTEVAKLRAARVMWANIARAYGGGADSQKMFIHARTSLTNKTRLDPHTNMLRVTTETLAATLGGADSIHAGAYDESYREPGSFSRRMARNTQLILREEAQVWHPSDAAGGSYYVEWLTARLARAGWELFQKLEKMGGMVAALREGYPQRETKACASRQKENVAKRERILVGVNRYTHPKAREGGAGQAETETGGDSLSTVESIPPLRLAADFERLGSAIKAEYPEGVSILLLLLGTASDHKAPAEFAGEFFAAAGLETETAAITAGDAERIDSVLEKDPDILVFCTSPGRYVNEGRPLIRNIRREKPRIRIVVVGNPESARGDFPEEGVEAIIHEGVDVPRVVSFLLAAPGGRS